MKDFDAKFSNEYYIVDAIRHSNKWKRLKAKVNEELNVIGLPIPSDGFKSAKEYSDWTKKLVFNCKSSKEITNNVFDEFNLDKSNRYLQLGIRDLLFFGSTGQFTPNIQYSTEFDKDKNVYLNLKIYPWTTKMDLETLEVWKIIENVRLNGIKNFKKSKNKEWENFSRDLEMYKLYLTVKEKIKNGNNKFATSKRELISKSAIYSMQFEKEFALIEEKYGINDGKLFEQIRSIVHRCKKVFGKTRLL